MSRSKCTKVELNKKAISETLLYSQEVIDCMMEIAEECKNKYGENAKCYPVKKYGVRSNRARVFIDAPYAEASKDNKLLKVL